MCCSCFPISTIGRKIVWAVMYRFQFSRCFIFACMSKIVTLLTRVLSRMACFDMKCPAKEANDEVTISCIVEQCYTCYIFL